MLTLAGMEADVIMAKLLPFQRQMVAELIEDDGLCVTAPGLGWTRVLAVLLYLQILRRRNAAERGAVLVVGCTDWQRRALRDELLMLDPQLKGSEHDAVDSAEDIVLPEDVGDPDEVPDDIVEENVVEPELPVDITNSTPSLQRIRLYRTKSCLFITTRILVVDMLNSRVRGNQVSGVVVLNAHRVTDMSGEAFAVRLFRMANRRGTVRAFSDQPVRLSSGFCKVCCTWPLHLPHLQPTMDHPSMGRHWLFAVLQQDCTPCTALCLPLRKHPADNQGLWAGGESHESPLSAKIVPLAALPGAGQRCAGHAANGGLALHHYQSLLH